MMSLSIAAKRSAAFVARQTAFRTVGRPISTSSLRFAEEGQAEVVLVGCGAPNRGTFFGKHFHVPNLFWSSAEGCDSKLSR